MATTTRTRLQLVTPESASALSWRIWPLVDWRRSSWVVPVGAIALSYAVWYLSGSWLLSISAAAGLAATCWQFLLPIEYEVTQLGIRRHVLRRTRLVPWHAIRAYQLRPTGIVLYQRADPTKFDLLRSLFVPCPADPDELVVALRPHLSHAVELP